jgi:ATP-binding cassette, subfamily B, multidrug efflux pump
MTRNIHDVETLQELFSTGVVGLLTDACMIIGIVAIMFTMSWQLALIALVVLLVIIYLSRFYRRKARDVFRESRQALASLNATLQESISGIVTIKAFGQEEHILRRFGAINTAYRDILLRSVHYNAMFFPIIEVFSAVTVGVTLWYGGLLIGSEVILPGVIVAFVQYIQRMYQPIRDIAEKYNIMQAAMASSERIFELLDTANTITNAERTPTRPRSAKAVEFEDVWLSYDPAEPVLKGISFSVEPGAKIALVGPTGHGKTSIISALCRFYEIQRGTIRVHGVDIRQWNKQDLRARLGLVLQEPFVFSGTIADNITLGDQRIDRARLVKACEKTRLADFVARLPLGYDHEVRERGTTLSHGQRQLLSFARALAFDPEILLLDEATSSVDTETERLIQEATRELLAERTALIVAHRLSTVEDADRILVVHKGEIREQGTHAELLATNGLYKTLYDLQFVV